MGDHKKVFIALTVILWGAMALFLFPTTAYADAGPKPSVHIRFENMGEELCYGTLLAEQEAYGPHSVWDGRQSHIDPQGLDLDIWEAFAGYTDPDGYHFWQVGWQVNESKEIAWTYYPPTPFKILLYYPETGSFVSSGIYERYAFDSYYTVDMAEISAAPAQPGEPFGPAALQAVRSYQYRQELFSLAARILITILLEMGIALLFGFWEKRQLGLLMWVNTLTQILLNILLNIVNYDLGAYAFVAFYVLLELAVMAAEAALYCTLLKKRSPHPRKNGFYIAYSLVANAVSFCGGLFIAQLLPGIF